MCPGGMDMMLHDWNSDFACPLDQFPGDRNNWSWKQWRARAGRWSAHQQSRIVNPRFSPKLRPVCSTRATVVSDLRNTILRIYLSLHILDRYLRGTVQEVRLRSVTESCISFTTPHGARKVPGGWMTTGHPSMPAVLIGISHIPNSARALHYNPKPEQVRRDHSNGVDKAQLGNAKRMRGNIA